MTATLNRDAQQPAGEALSRAREMVLAYGWNATTYQIVNPGISLWFSRSGDAVIGYVERRRTRVVAGAPVCPPERLRDVVSEFEYDCTDCSRRVCYFGAEERLESLLTENRTHTMVLLGAQPSWDPGHWPGIIASKASLRGQLNRS